MSSKLNNQLKSLCQTAAVLKCDLQEGVAKFKLNCSELNTFTFDVSTKQKRRLGHFIELLFEGLLKKQLLPESYLLSNLQIFSGKQTIGELDYLIINPTKKKIKHIELAYKFYLYDPNEDEGRFEKWIGPNRKDRLSLKYNKLFGKQLPLFFEKETHNTLAQKNIVVADYKIEQQFCLLGQLFLPFGSSTTSILEREKEINPHAVVGVYYNWEQFCTSFDETNKYFIPTKLDWFLNVAPSTTEWLGLEAFQQKIKPYVSSKTSTMVWVQKPTGLERCFIVFWNI